MLAREHPIDETFMYAMDFELWNYLSYVAKARFVYIPEALAVFEVSGDNKTSTGGERIINEVERVYVRYCGERVPLTYWHRRLRLPLERARKSAGMPVRICVRPLQIVLTVILGAFYGLDRVRAMNWSAFL